MHSQAMHSPSQWTAVPTITTQRKVEKYSAIQLSPPNISQLNKVTLLSYRSFEFMTSLNQTINKIRSYSMTLAL